LAGVQAVEQSVQIREAGRYAGHHAAMRAHRLDLVEGRLEHVGEDPKSSLTRRSVTS
jgi:hypothetical protein